MIYNLNGYKFATEFAFKAGISSSAIFQWKTKPKMLKIGKYTFLKKEHLPNKERYRDVFDSCEDLGGYYPLTAFEEEILVPKTYLPQLIARDMKNKIDVRFEYKKIQTSKKAYRYFIKIPDELKKYIGTNDTIHYIKRGDKDLDAYREIVKVGYFGKFGVY